MEEEGLYSTYTLRGLEETSMNSRNVDDAADQAAIREIDREIVRALNARDVETFLGFLADNARMQPPNAPILDGKPAIREMIEGLFALPDFSVTHTLDRIVVSESGDLAYISYVYQLTEPTEEGGTGTEEGKDISIYQKQADGNWKLTIDMWSANQPE
ncbi:MAG TPA: hypothetical protein DCM64_01085 [Gammaproteobacteria bacterium]|jgi:uncharacterized protein (TIGR02246 family)|nr:hypothetical protein [Gammaproteobacteria bacterium]|tara:strand:- start:73 stop:546 length:474 start_codon:yes stop_codon:yes gene_type:complete